MKNDKTLYDDGKSTVSRRRDRRASADEYEEIYESDEQEDEEVEYDEYDDEASDESEDEYDEEDGYDEQDEYEEEDPDEESDEYEEDDEYDDVFSLEDDLKREQKKQFIQYICVASAAAVIVALVLFAGIAFTKSHIENEKQAAILAAEKLAAENLAKQDELARLPLILDAWPSSQFPGIPAIDSPEYETTIKDGCAKIAIPSSVTASYDAYTDELTSEYGASVYVKTKKLTVLNLEGTEIHLVSGNQQNRVVLCDEDEFDFTDVDYRAFDLPTGFKLVSAKADSAMGRILTYRLAAVDKALEYADSLVSQYGWKLAGSFDMSYQTFYATYTKNNLQMTLDYYSSGEDFTIKLDYVN